MYFFARINSVYISGGFMTNNYDNYGYENDNSHERSSFIRRLLIVLMIVIAIILIILLVKSCSNRKKNTPEVVTTKYEEVLLDGAKKYFDVNYDKYPKNAGECFEIELQALIEGGYVKAEDLFIRDLKYTEALQIPGIMGHWV